MVPVNDDREWSRVKQLPTDDLDFIDPDTPTFKRIAEGGVDPRTDFDFPATRERTVRLLLTGVLDRMLRESAVDLRIHFYESRGLICVAVPEADHTPAGSSITGDGNIGLQIISARFRGKQKD